MQQIWLILLILGVVANLVVGVLAYRDGEMGHVATSIMLAILCAGVAYLRIKQMEKK
ncbi:MAG: hypothetical protein AAF714_10090 [Pseudomonadota bacterium]